MLRYYALFRYPLRPEEILANASLPLAKEDVTEGLASLLQAGAIHADRGFYSTDAGIVSLVDRRLAANALAAEKIPKALGTGRLIARFPFVRFVGISGSLSKGYADQQSDFDFFIVTAANRLWVCRTLLHLFKKATFLLSREHQFCMNYFLDESRLQLEEQNIYTAIELSSMIPVCGASVYGSMQEANGWWVRNFLPNGYRMFYKPAEVPESCGRLRSFAEKVIDVCGDWLNARLMSITDRRWRRKWRKRNYPEADYNLAFKTTLYHSKNHPANYQKKVLNGLGG